MTTDERVDTTRAAVFDALTSELDLAGSHLALGDDLWIRVSRDAFAAEFHSAGGIFIDIITQPGQGSIRGGVQTRLRDGSMSGRPPADISTNSGAVSGTS